MSQSTKSELKESSPPSAQVNQITYLNATDAAAVDRDLMGEGIAFSIDQLMELAGLSCAQAIHHFYTPASKYEKVLIVCGPGNNGGDGLVCARHLQQFGFAHIVVLYPKEPKQQLYKNLLQTLRAHDIQIVDKLPDSLGSFNLIVDAIFGFSFDPTSGIRAPYDSILEAMIKVQSSVPVVAIDVPSGWHVDQGDLSHGKGLQPDALISLTAPKLCAQQFKGRFHAIGGRFMPKHLLQKYNITLPQYAGSAQFIDASSHGQSKHSSSL